MGRSALGAVGCDWPPLAGAAPRTAAAVAAGVSVWRPAAAAAAGSCGREWGATRRPRAGALRGRTRHPATGPRAPPGDELLKSDSGTSVREEAAAATPGPGGDSRSEVRAPGRGAVTARPGARASRAERGRREAECGELRERVGRSGLWSGDPERGWGTEVRVGGLEGGRGTRASKGETPRGAGTGRPKRGGPRRGAGPRV